MHLRNWVSHSHCSQGCVLTHLQSHKFKPLFNLNDQNDIKLNTRSLATYTAMICLRDWVSSSAYISTSLSVRKNFFMNGRGKINKFSLRSLLSQNIFILYVLRISIYSTQREGSKIFHWFFSPSFSFRSQKNSSRKCGLRLSLFAYFISSRTHFLSSICESEIFTAISMIF